MKKRLSMLLALAITVSLAGCGAGSAEKNASEGEASATQVYKLATDAPADYPTTIALQKFADDVKEQTEGRITIELYPSAQLGDENAYLQQLQFGAVDFAKSSVAPLAQFCNELNALSLPYLFDSTEHMFNVLNGELGQDIFKSFEDANIVGLGYANNGSRCFFTKEQVKNVKDLENKKLRVQSSPMMLGMVESLGGFPQAIPSTELYSALQTGVVEGAENNINTFYSDSLYEQAPYFVMDQHNIQPEIIIASKMTWDKMSKDDQTLIRDVMASAMEYQNELWIEREKESEDKLVAEGVTVYEPTEEEEAGFREKCETIYENPELGQPYADFVEKVRAVK